MLLKMVWKKNMSKKYSKKKNFSKKRTYRRKLKRNVRFRNNVSIGRGFPAKMVVNHTYSEYVYIGNTAGSLANYNFACNGLYDPNLTGTGHQPSYFDTMAAIYGHYHVIGAKIKVTFIPADTGNSPLVVGILMNDDTTNSNSNYSAIIEQPRTKHKVIGQGGVDTRQVVYAKWSAKKTFGKGIMANNSLQGTPITNPSELTVFNLFTQPLDLVSNNACYAMVNITYIAVWNEIRDFVQS